MDTEPESDSHEVEQRWRNDVRTFGKKFSWGFGLSWLAFMGSLFREGYQSYREAMGVPTMSLAGYFWAVTLIVVMITAFKAWQRERREVEKRDGALSVKENDLNGLRQEIGAEKRARESAIAALSARIDFMRKPRFEIECGEQTTKRRGQITPQYPDPLNPGLVILGQPIGIAFFGFRLWNRGIVSARNCKVRLISIEKNGVPVCGNIAALPFEADNREDDLEVVDVANDIPQRPTVFSVFHNGQIAAGSGNMKWRHDDIAPLFQETGEYTFVVAISDQTDGSEKVTQRERFTCHWRGNHNSTVIEYRGPNKYIPLP
jgi:hypothetical protein